MENNVPPTPPPLPGSIIQTLEQFESMLRDLAPLMATYRNSLLEAGIPKALVDRLVLDFHHVFWSSNLGNKPRQ
jgi:hypothetical protein